MDDCIFCKIVAGEIPSHKLYEDDRTIVFLDIFPASPGHALVIQKEHEADLLASSEANVNALLSTARKMAPVIMNVVGAEDANFIFNKGANAGQTVFHTHFHIIPRFKDDGLKQWPQAETDHEALCALATKIKDQL